MEDSIVLYHRRGNRMRLKLQSVTNHELREVLVGLWARLDPADRTDHINELTHYNQDPASWLSPTASVVAHPEIHEGYVDIARAKRFEHSDLPEG